MSNSKNKICIAEIKRGRRVNENTKILLFARAAGRCELCNEWVIKDSTTNENFNWGEKAHIYAFSDNGPRANKTEIEKNDVDNLLLTCPNCHEKIDKKGQDKYYSVEYLREAKSKHEDRVKLLTSFDSRRQTKVLKMIANINNEVVKLSTVDIINALIKERFYPCEEKFEEIDYTDNSGLNNNVYWKSKEQEINQKLDKFYSDIRREKIEHVSIFGLGPIPLLMFLGSKLDNKIKTKVFQCHRDGESWAWSKGKPGTVYKFKLIKKGVNKGGVALLLSLSGFVNRRLIPDIVNKRYYIYELSVNKNPNYNFLRTEKDLFNFEKEFTTAISEIKNKHKNLKGIDIFPAIPAPVAVVCGRALNKNADPKLRVFNKSNKGKFRYTLTVN